MSETISIQELRNFQQVFGREGCRTPAQQYVYDRLRQGLQYDQMTFQPQKNYAPSPDGSPVWTGEHFDPLAAAITDGMRRGFIFIRDRVEAEYQTTGAE